MPSPPEDPPSAAGASPVVAALSFAAILGIAVVDWWVTQGLSFSIFYLVPVSLLAWRGSLTLGLVGAVVASFFWFVADYNSTVYVHASIGVWNGFVRLSIFVAAAVVLDRHRKSLGRERALARIDGLTGCRTSRAFYGHLELELARSQRSGEPLTVAFIDLDHFKNVNDRLGHPAGDRVLASVGERLRAEVRPTDIVGRLGGDEFGLVLPGLGEAAAKDALGRLLAAVTTVLDGIDPLAGEVGASFGAITCQAPDIEARGLLQAADDLMYRAKRAGGARLHLELWPPPPSPPSLPSQ
ncbi:MAG: GGDEF domain-containing protein [Deltaproteobacteria bacterium]|nr:GGDEF domain-containing protein [Deltaproteobacteria bacterium]